jgi:hypothetical protein
LKVTIHQPDFLPWPGLFNKISHCDAWIVLDHVENNPRDAAFWGRRVRILSGDKPRWLSIPLSKPVERGRIGVPIRDMTISCADSQAMPKCLALVRASYAGAPRFAEYFPLVERYFVDTDNNLTRRNMRFIEAVLALLGIRTQLIYSSTLGIHSRSTQLLIDMLKAVGATTYRCGGGAQGYQQDRSFAEAGITLEYNSYVQPVYAQAVAAFEPGLSIIDALFSVGREAVSGWMHQP